MRRVTRVLQATSRRASHSEAATVTTAVLMPALELIV